MVEKKLKGAAKASAARKAKKLAGLKPYPFTGGAVNENAAIRMIKMVIPNCPADPNPEILAKDGTTMANPRYTGEPNCQQEYKFNNMGKWDVAKCESLGHDPWRTVFRKRIVEDVIDDRPTVIVDGAEVPNPEFGYVIKQRTRTKVEKRLNVIQVSDNPRHTNRTEMALALARGCRTLEEFDIASPCEFRNCTKKQEIDTRYGKFCGERHARLVGADMRKVVLPVGGDPYTEDQALEEREAALENIAIRKG